MKKLKTALLSALFILCMTLTSFAGIDYSMEESPSIKKTITWSCSEEDAEYRYVAGEASESNFEAAIPAGRGGSASITVSDNGVYTLFAKTGDTTLTTTVPVVNIDKNGPDITLTNVSRNTDGTVDVTYEASDYFGVADTRIAVGSQSASAFDSATSISGGVIRGLSGGTYTIFAKDIAGNITIYPLTVEASAETWSTAYAESSEWSTEWSTEWGSNWLYYDYDESVSVLISKCDLVTGEELEGAKLKIVDNEDGSVVVEWVTNGTQTKIVNKLIPGKTYELIEIYAPNGYEVAESITFTVEDTGKITHVIMYDKPKESNDNSGNEHSSTVKENKNQPDISSQVPAESGRQVPGESYRRVPAESAPSKLPQTGGLMEQRVISLAGSVLLIIIGLAMVILMKRYKKKC